jgi:hypothetical protein
MEWISVKDKLPEFGQEVIVFCPKSRHIVTALARFCRYEGDVKFYWDNYYPMDGFTHVQDAVTHWQKLPEPPKQ